MNGHFSAGTQTNIDGGTTTVYTFDGTLVHYTFSGVSYQQTYVEKLTINKDGTYTDVVTQADGSVTKTGDWYFGRRNKDLDIKNKESVVFIVKSEVDAPTSGSTTTTTYTGQDCPVSTYSS